MKKDQQFLQVIQQLSSAIAEPENAKKLIDDAKKELSEINLKTKKRKLTLQEKQYKKLADIEIILNKVECHENHILKLVDFQTVLLYHLIKANTNYSEDTKEKWWQQYCRISD